MIDIKALNVFNSDEIVVSYEGSESLQLSELKIYELYKDKINNSVFLDLGIGTGRTTLFFENKCHRYFGIDISPNMIHKAKEKTSSKHLSVGDARDLSLFESNSVDVVLFSFNGIDYLNLRDRIKVFDEIHRVLKKDGLFIFSTHNIRSLSNLFQFKFQSNEIFSIFMEFIQKILFILKLLFVNHVKIYALFFPVNHVVFNDGVYNFSLTTYYSDLECQENNLIKMGFRDIKMFSNKDEHLITVKEKKLTREPWIYYTCINKKKLSKKALFLYFLCKHYKLK